MTTSQLATTTAYFLLVALSSISVGSFFSKKNSLGLSILIGLPILGNVGLLLGLLSAFTKPVILAILFVSVVLFRKALLVTAITELKHYRLVLSQNKKDLISFVLILTSVFIVGSLYLASLQPPFSIDELAYHFPEANQIVANHKIALVFPGGNFYGNIPKLMEIIFAEGIAVGSYSLAHAVNFLFLVGFLLFIFKYLSQRYSFYTASWSVFLICLFDDFVWNATTGYIDAATSILEITSLFVITQWLEDKNNKSYLFISGLLMGSALAMKYSPIPTALFLICLIGLGSFRKIFKNIFIFSLPALIMGGYWYLKNLILYRNPFYPLYLGHPGMTEVEYQSLINAIQQFQPKTVSTFFNLISHFKTVNGFTVYLSFFIFPLAFIFDKKNRKTTGALIIYFLIQLFYWFFIATHQIRFFTTGTLTAIILSALAISLVKKRYFIALVFLLLVMCLYSKGPFFKTAWRNFWYTKLNVVRRQYALGNESDDQFYSRYFGCKYSIIKYLTAIGYQGKVIDNWTVWMDRPWPLLPSQSLFISLDINVSEKEKVLDSLKSNHLEYLYLNNKVKQKHLQTTNPYIAQNRDIKLPTEELILRHSQKVFSAGDCEVFKINEKKLQAAYH